MDIKDKIKTSGLKKKFPKENKGAKNLNIPYVPIFKRTPARITEPIVGASTCASGNHMCTGNKGTLTAREIKKHNHRTN